MQRVANTYLTDTGKNVLWYSRKAGTDEDPELAALTGQAKAMAKQALAQIEQIEDPAQLEQGLAQMKAMLAQVPPEIKPALELVIKKADRTPRNAQRRGRRGGIRCAAQRFRPRALDC